MSSGADAPPSYNVTIRRGMSVESMTAPPTHRQQYGQPENQERVIERQLNLTHQTNSAGSIPNFPTDPQLQQQQQSIFSSCSQTTVSQTTSLDSSNSLNNITSASLANLKKGMEQNLSQMSQNMNQSRPFADIPVTSSASSEQSTNKPPPSSTSQHAPSVNNTYVNAHMSIGQVNIQNVTASQTYQGPSGGGRPMQQNLDVTMNNFNSGMVPPQSQPDPMYKPSPQQQPTAPSPAVSIQNKGRNTIQYLPVSQPSLPSSHEPAIPTKATFDFLPDRFPSPSPNFYPPDNGMIGGPQPPPQSRHPSAPGGMYSGPQPGISSEGINTFKIQLLKF